MTGAWPTGDHLGIVFPAHIAALRDGGAAFLTEAFRAAGALDPDNRVVRVDGCDEVPGGSTGRKASLDVEYLRAGPPTALFVKFSRDFDDPVRDHGRTQMAAEVTFATLAQAPGFPIAVPRTMFADYHGGTGTGVLITERIPFGRNGIEPQHHKCRDDELPSPQEHYRALLTALARLVGAHRSGVLPAQLTESFPVDLKAAAVGEPVPLTAGRLDRRLAALGEFARAHPALLPAGVGSPEFLGRLGEQAHEVMRREPDIWRSLACAQDHIGLCHWNANVDNAWFWRDADGTMRCGLLDWGCVSRMNVAMAIWGSLSGAETALWDDSFNELTEVFCAEVAASGGPHLDPAGLRRHVLRYTALMGITWLLGVPALVAARVPDAGPDTTRFDPRIRDDESVRAPLQMLSNVLNLWRTRDMAAALAELG
ncbi:hypothetical protein O6P37_01075 [Mycobacterium sp. CPCC 205372]|uniref:Aminoglycoside phosphotransferase domain-containing protein n=1 Tax=Mycobacterium hippophais TaxID=3016340 RepID=A0ABT4PLL4_9MYCO|nr:hypothetical protein [Mycobacterium hippophais]MCZ8377446.1 hypothetical protein [Mycobacterium hippophais]